MCPVEYAGFRCEASCTSIACTCTDAAYACRRGVKIIEINADPSPISEFVDVFILGKAAEVLPMLVDKSLESQS